MLLVLGPLLSGKFWKSSSSLEKAGNISIVVSSQEAMQYIH